MSADWITLLAVAASVAIGAMSPGPSFVYVSRLALARSRRHGLAGAAGMGLGSVIFAVAAMVGVGALLQVAGWAFTTLKIVGGLYLLVLGVRMIRHAGHQVAEEGTEPPQGPLWRSAGGGAVAQVSNPKAVVVYGSIFAAALPPHPSAWLFAAIPLAVLVIESSWYAAVAIGMSAAGPRRIYRRFARAIDRTAGAMLGAIGGWFTVDGIRTAMR